MDITEEKIKDVVDQIVRGYHPEKIIMFGSRAWGTPSSESDLDLFIIRESDDRPFERGIQIRSLLWQSTIPMDILVRTPKEIAYRLSFDDPFYLAILNRGKILYERR